MNMLKAELKVLPMNYITYTKQYKINFLKIERK